MAVVKIENVPLKTNAGWTAYIEGIELTDHDLFKGDVIVPSARGDQMQPARWNGNGTMSGGPQDGGGNIKVADLHDLLATAKKLNASGA